MTIEFTGKRYEFQENGKRKVVGEFDGATITSNAGVLLLRELEEKSQVLKEFAECFTDYRNVEQIEHTVEELVKQRTYGIVLGYEDLIDHDELRLEPLLAVVVGKIDPTVMDRKQLQDQGKALAGKSTLNRLELRSDDPKKDGRYKKIAANTQAIDKLMVEHFIKAHNQAPKEVILDLDTTENKIHGNQEGRFYHGYYGGYCYLPLYIFCGDFLLCARLRQAKEDASAGCLDEVKRIVQQIREFWPEMKITLRADSAFCRDEIMDWCEQQKIKVDYLFGLAKNSRLTQEITLEMQQAKTEFELTKKTARIFKDFTYQTLDSWTVERRVVAKAQHLEKGSNPRFIVTSLSKEGFEAKSLYQDVYCQRGDMENRIKEQKLDLHSDRTSTEMLKSNQLRLYFSSMAYIVLNDLRRLGLKDTLLSSAQCSTIRLKLLKFTAKVKLSLSRISVSFTSSYLFQSIFHTVYCNLLLLKPLGG